MNCTLFCLYFKLDTLWHKHFATVFFLCIFVLLLLTSLGLIQAHYLTVKVTGLPPTDPGGGGPWSS